MTPQLEAKLRMIADQGLRLDPSECAALARAVLELHREVNWRDQHSDSPILWRDRHVPVEVFNDLATALNCRDEADEQ